MTRSMQGLAGLVFLLASQASWSIAITDLTVFSTNEFGNVWLGWIWNTQGNDTDTPNRWNLYVSEDPLSDTSPDFVNGFNDPSTRVSLGLNTGDNFFAIYGEGVGSTSGFDPYLHFVLNIYLEGNQSSPDISGLQQNNSNASLQPASHPNGMDIFGNAGQQEAATLNTMIGNQLIELTEFFWNTNGDRDVVWPHWANDPDYANGSRTLDYFGAFNIRVSQVPVPGTVLLVSLGFGLLSLVSRKNTPAPGSALRS